MAVEAGDKLWVVLRRCGDASGEDDHLVTVCVTRERAVEYAEHATRATHTVSRPRLEWRENRLWREVAYDRRTFWVHELTIAEHEVL